MHLLEQHAALVVHGWMSPRQGVRLIWSAKLGAAVTKDAATVAAMKRTVLKDMLASVLRRGRLTDQR